MKKSEITTLKEVTKNSTLVYEGPVFKVYSDEVILPDGNTSKRDVVSHLGGVCIAARKSDNTFLMVRQYRYALQREFREFVAGKREPNDTPLERAKAELEEETGYIAHHWQYMGHFIPTCGYDNENIELFYADDLEFVAQHLDDTEFLQVFSMPLEEIIKEIEDGNILDGKTIVLAYKLDRLQKELQKTDSAVRG